MKRIVAIEDYGCELVVYLQDAKKARKKVAYFDDSCIDWYFPKDDDVEIFYVVETHTFERMDGTSLPEYDYLLFDVLNLMNANRPC